MRRLAAGAALAVLVVLSILAAAAAAASAPATLDGSAALDLADVAVVVPDDGGVAGPEAILAVLERGEEGAGDPPAAGTVWLAARVTNASATDRWALALRHAHFARVDLWVYDGRSLASHAAAGIGVGGADARPRFALGYEFPLTLPAGATRSLVLRLEPVLLLAASPTLAIADAARVEAAWRSVLFPMLLGAFLGMAALHVILFVRFGGLANLLFAGTAAALVLDWFTWLGGPHALWPGLTVEATVRLSTVTWFAATLLVVTFCLNFFAAGRRAVASYAALLGAFALFVAAYGPAAGWPGAQLALIVVFLAVAAAILLGNGVAAVRRGVSGARLALAAYAVMLANEMLTYGSAAVPALAAFSAWFGDNFGLFDTGTLLSQILANGLFSLALWERVRAMTREREGALRAERLKTVHVAQLSHDIRSPLHAVQSAIGALVAKSPSGIADLRQVEAVQSAVSSVVAMLDDLVGLARDGPAPPPRPAALDLRRVVADATDVARARLGDRPVDVRFEVADEIPPLVRADGVAVRRVLGNLLANAADATSRGTVTVSLSRPAGDAAGARVRVEVSDTGSGMTARRVEELLGPHADGDGRRSPGLGLRVARRLVEGMGGALGASSRPGFGTTVWFEAPAPPAGPGAEGVGAGGAEVHGRAPPLRLLLAEDDGLAAAATAVVLTADGHEVTRAGSAAEAVGLAESQAFDLVLMDLDLGGGPGLDAIRLVRAAADPVRSGVPIVVVTGDRAAGEEALRAPLGVRSVLVKPFDAGELRRAVAGAVGLGARLAAPDGGGDFLADLAAMLPAPELHALLATGRDQIRSGVESVEAATDGGRLDDARRWAHRLASSAAVLGLGRLVAAARAAEAAAAGGDRDALAASLAEVRSSARAALAALDRRLAGALAGPR